VRVLMWKQVPAQDDTPFALLEVTALSLARLLRCGAALAGRHSKSEARLYDSPSMSSQCLSHGSLHSCRAKSGAAAASAAAALIASRLTAALAWRASLASAAVRGATVDAAARLVNAAGALAAQAQHSLALYRRTLRQTRERDTVRASRCHAFFTG
jgi:hypothetical protein